jgi:hypothetical protein
MTHPTSTLGPAQFAAITFTFGRDVTAEFFKGAQ